MSIACGVLTLVYVAIHHLISKEDNLREECYFDKPIYKFLDVLRGATLLSIFRINFVDTFSSIN